MSFAIEIVRGENFERVVDRVVLEQNRAEHRLLGFDILRGNSSQNVIGLCGHHILQLHNLRAGVFHFGGYLPDKRPTVVPMRKAHGESILDGFPNLSTARSRQQPNISL